MKKWMKTCLAGLCATVGLSAISVAAVELNQPEDVVAQADATYTTKDIAMMGRVAGWYGNGNFEIRLTLGYADWSGDSAQKNYVGEADLATALNKLGFFDKIKLGDKTLREWGCTACYDNFYKVNSGEPDLTLFIPLAMGEENMAAASAAGIGANTPFTVLEGALIPSDAYLQGDTTATVFRAGCDYVTTNSTVAYGIYSVGKTEVESVKYVQGHDGNNGYFGFSLVGDDYLGSGSQLEVNQNYSFEQKYSDAILVNGESGKTGGYGLFNLGSKGQGYFSFAMYATEEEMESVTIPAGTQFPSRAMTDLREVNGNPVYIMYETQTDVTFYKQADGSWATALVEKETTVESAFVEVDDEGSSFTFIKLATNDYPTSIDNWNGGIVDIKAFLANTNFYSKVLVDGEALGGPAGEVLLNVWGNKGVIAFRTSKGGAATKITVLAGCQIPTYNALANGAREVYAVKEDISFVKTASGEWVNEADYVAGYLDAARVELDAYKAGAFRAAEEAQRAEIVANAKAQLVETLSETEVQAIVANAKTAIDALKTAAQYADEELAAAKAAANAEIEGYKANAVYFAEQAAAKDAAIAAGKAAVAGATTEAEIADAVAGAKAAIDAIKEKSAVVADAKWDIENYKADVVYADKEMAQKGAILAEATAAVDAATTAAEVANAVASMKAKVDMLLTAAEAYVTSNSAFIGRIQGWYGNGNFTMAVTVGGADWSNAVAGVKAYDGDLSLLLKKLGFFDHIVIGGKTLAEWGCVACYDNGYELNTGEPDNIMLFHLSMGKANMDAASNAGVGANSLITVKEGAVIPSYGYLSKTSNVVYYAGATYVTSASEKAYGIESVAQTTIESVSYVQGHDGVCGYLGVSFVGDDYLADGSQAETVPNYSYTNMYTNKILVNGEADQVKYYGLFNLGENGKGYFAFQINIAKEDVKTITIPAGTRFPTRAMMELKGVNGNPVYIMYELKEDVTLYNTEDGFVSYAEYVAAYGAEQATALEGYKAGLFRENEENQRLALIETAKAAILVAATEADVDAAVSTAKTAIDGLKTAAQWADEELAAVKTAAYAEIAGYKADVVYLAEQAAEKAAIIEEGNAAIKDATTEEEIATAVASTKAGIDGIVTKATIVNAAQADVEGYKADVVYLEAQATAKATIITEAKVAIEAAESEAAIDEIVAGAKAAIDEIKTKAEVETEALNAVKAAANTTVDNLKKDIDPDLYDDEGMAAIATLYANVKAAIAAAESEEEVNALVAAFEAALAAVPEKQPEQPSNSGSTGATEESPAKSGCSGVASGVAAAIMMLGVAATLLKKKED